MAMLLIRPSQLLKVPGFRFTVEVAEKPERSSVLFLPISQIVMTGVVFFVKSKNGSIAPVTLQWNPNVCPPESGVDVGNP